MAKNGDTEAIQRAIREITRIQDGTIVKTLKSMLERQARLFSRVEAIEDQLDAIVNTLRSARSG